MLLLLLLLMLWECWHWLWQHLLVAKQPRTGPCPGTMLKLLWCQLIQSSITQLTQQLASCQGVLTTAAVAAAFNRSVWELLGELGAWRAREEWKPCCSLFPALTRSRRPPARR